MGLFGKLFGIGDAKNDVENYQPNFAEGDFVFQARDVFTIQGRGTAVTGKVISGEVHIGDTIVINGRTKSEVTNIEMPGELSEIAKAGDVCCIFLSKISRHEVRQGDYLTLLKKDQNNNGEQKISNDLVCKNCGSKLNGVVCEICGYNSNLSNVFKNIITDKKAKEDIGDHVLAYLLNQKKIYEQEFKNIIIEFGYLFLDDNNVYSSLLKVVLPQNTFGSSKIFYIGIQNERIMLLENGFNEDMFKKTSQDMLVMHKVDVNNINKDDYYMQLS